MMKNYSPRLWSATFLVAGTSIGAGMIALPITTAQAGFIPSISIMALTWIIAMITGLCLIETGFWMKKSDAHIISMSSTFLGPWGKRLSWLLYLFIAYSSLIAYTAGGSDLIASALEKLFHIDLSKLQSNLLFMVFFAPVILISHKTLGKINSLFFILLLISYVLLIFMGTSEIKPELLYRQNWPQCVFSLPMLLAAFSFQMMVPSLHPYLHHHKPSLYFSIIVGTFLTFLIYLAWQLIIHGSIPLEGAHGLDAALEQGDATVHYFGIHMQNPYIEKVAAFFAFFALATSFLGISLGLFDFLSDGLNIPKTRTGSLILTGIIVLPTLFCSISFKRIFFLALDVSGGYGDALLTGMIPALMVWIGRYRMNKGSLESKMVGGGKTLLLCVFAFYAFVVLIETLMRI